MHVAKLIRHGVSSFMSLWAYFRVQFSFQNQSHGHGGQISVYGHKVFGYDLFLNSCLRHAFENNFHRPST